MAQVERSREQQRALAVARARARVQQSPAREATDAAKLLVRGNTGYREPGIGDAIMGGVNKVNDAVTHGVAQIPFAHEGGGALNAAISAGYNLPGLATSGDLGEYGDKVAGAYDDQVRGTKATSNRFREEHPNVAALTRGTSLGLQGVGLVRQLPKWLGGLGGSAAPGTVAGTGVPLTAGTGTAGGVFGTAKEIGRSGLVGAADSAAWSWLYGLGAEEGGSMSERVDRANEYLKWGAALGGPLGAGLRTAMDPGVQREVSKVFTSAPQRALKQITPEGGGGITSGSVNALRSFLRRMGYKRSDVDAGLIEVAGAIKSPEEGGIGTPFFASLLKERFPAAERQIDEIWGQLATAPPGEGKSAQILTKALDQQLGSQEKRLGGVLTEAFGPKKASDELADLAEQRTLIGDDRAKVVEYALTDKRVGKQANDQLNDTLEVIAGDQKGRLRLIEAARSLGYTGKNDEVLTAAIQSDPGRLLQKFGEKARGSTDDAVLTLRRMSESLMDDLARLSPRNEKGQFAKQVPEGQQGAYRAEQQRFAENYAREDVIREAQGQFRKAARDVDGLGSQEFIGWYSGLPKEQQELVQTVVRADLETMLSGGKVDELGAYTTTVGKKGVHRMLNELFGDEGGRVSEAIQAIMREGSEARALRPSSNVTGEAKAAARNLYTKSSVARLSDKIPDNWALAVDIGAMMAGGAPVFTPARLAARTLRPGSKTREGIAQILSASQRNPTRVKPDAPEVAPIVAPPAEATPPVAPAPKPQVKITDALPKKTNPANPTSPSREGVATPPPPSKPRAIAEEVSRRVLRRETAPEPTSPAEPPPAIAEPPAPKRPGIVSRTRDRVGDMMDGANERYQNFVHGAMGEMDGSAFVPLVGGGILGAMYLQHKREERERNRPKRSLAATIAGMGDAIARGPVASPPSLKPDPLILGSGDNRFLMLPDGNMVPVSESRNGELLAFVPERGGWVPVRDLTREKEGVQ